ncbi:MAG TPA: ATP-binding protein [Planctomycetota bacterium]|nr:ATP-binding protein [Planctomycetota bacterium]
MRFQWRPRSIRFRLALWYTGGLAALLLLYAGFVLAFLHHALSTEVDQQLREDYEDAEQIAEDALERTPDGGVRWGPRPHHEDDAEVSGRRIEVVDASGNLLYRSSSQQRTADEPIRVLSRSYSVAGVPVMIRVARSEARLRHEVGELLLVFCLAFPLAVGLAGVGGYALARRALAPVGAMTERARTITAERLSERLPIDDAGDELGQLATVFNDTFARLERSFGELRRFTADASHELRTPLTAIRTVGEVGLREPRAPGAYREVIGSMLEDVDRMTRLVDSLLTLARADAGEVRLAFEPTDLSELAREVTGQLGVLAEERRQTLLVEAPGRVDATVDRLVLRQALINLVDNAIKYSPLGTRIRVRIGEGPAGPTMEVTNEGPGIPPEHRDRVFDRFYRVDTGRSRELGGTGLGLSIARWAVEAHGGRIELESEPGRGSTFRIVMPQTKPPRTEPAPTGVISP